MPRWLLVPTLGTHRLAGLTDPQPGRRRRLRAGGDRARHAGLPARGMAARRRLLHGDPDGLHRRGTARCTRSTIRSCGPSHYRPIVLGCTGMIFLTGALVQFITLNQINQIFGLEP